MRFNTSPYRCPLGKFQPTSMDVESVKRSGWQQEQILVVSPSDERLDVIEKEFVRQIGERLYGIKGGKNEQKIHKN